MVLGVLGTGMGWSEGIRSLIAERRASHEDEGRPGRWLQENRREEEEGHFERDYQGDYEEEKWEWGLGPEEKANKRRREASISMLSARAEMVQMLLEAHRMKDALKVLHHLAGFKDLKDDEEAQDILSSVFLDGAEMLSDQRRWDDALKFARKGLTALPKDSPLRGHLLMSIGRIHRSKGDIDRAMKSMEKAAKFFEKVRRAQPQKPSKQ
jgi:tetratricopeptide (TPR) repeat protein